MSKIKTVTYWETLMHYAKAVGDAKKSGDPEAIAEAVARCDAYEQAVLDSDECVLPPLPPAPPKAQTPRYDL